MTRLQIGQFAYATVNPEESWNLTGIILEKQAIYNIEACMEDGACAYEHNRPVTPDGFKKRWLAPLVFLKRLPRANWFALLGCINHDRQTYFKIGRAVCNFRPETDGHLICFANDAPGMGRSIAPGEIQIKISRVG